jgi:pilus assembly protein Flp/PilA
LGAIRLLLRKLRADQGGATAIEYGLIAALIAMGLVAGLSTLGGGAGGMWSDIAANVNEFM